MTPSASLWLCFSCVHLHLFSLGWIEESLFHWTARAPALHLLSSAPPTLKPLPDQPLWTASFEWNHICASIPHKLILTGILKIYQIFQVTFYILHVDCLTAMYWSGPLNKCVVSWVQTLLTVWLTLRDNMSFWFVCHFVQNIQTSLIVKLSSECALKAVLAVWCMCCRDIFWR